MNEMTPHPGDEGPGGSHRSGRLIRGIRISWNQEWQDQDGCAPPLEMLIPATKEVLQKWKDGKPEVIDALPLPDPDLLNSAIPASEWEIGLSGTPTPPWQHTVVAYGIDPIGAGTYTYVSATVGGHIAIDQLNDAIDTMKMLRGEQVMPLVRLTDRPMKTKFGLKSRPHFQIVDWRTRGNGAALPPSPPPLQLSSEAAPTAASKSEPAAATPSAHVPVAETPPPPKGRTPGKTTVTSGKPAGKSKIQVDLENRRPDLKPVFDDNLDDLPPSTSEP